MSVIVHERASPAATGAAGPVYLLLFPIPVVCFVGALVSDLVYARDAVLMWLHFSEWLITAGLAFGALAAIAALVELITARSMHHSAIGWGHIVLFYAAMIVELFNVLVHSVDGWTAVVPSGLILSIIGALLSIAAVATLFFVPVAWVRTGEVRRGIA